MSDAQQKTKRQIREGRLVIVASLYKKGWSVRKICERVKTDMQVSSCSPGTVHKDIQILLKEWRDARLSDMDDLLQLELERIDEAIMELWEAWERSKTDALQVSSKIKGVGSKSDIDAIEDEVKRQTSIEKAEKREAQCGDPRYISEIRQNLSERRKLLGLYAPDKKEISGNLDFGAFLMDASVIDDE
jgi:hypothetical protein